MVNFTFVYYNDHS